jgi:phytoene synthase
MTAATAPSVPARASGRGGAPASAEGAAVSRASAASPQAAGASGEPVAGALGAPSIAAAYAECERIGRASASNFIQAFRLLPPERRRGLAALYAFCRVVDDAADESASAARTLAAWRDELARALAGSATHPIAVAIGDAVRRFGIPPQHLEEILAGVEMDLERRRYETFDELRGYCYHVAAAVGLAALPILGCRDPQSRAYAEALGIALQLTNILRDLAEDAERGRIYLPLEDLRCFGYRERDLLTHARNAAFRDLVAFECARARTFYRAARASLPARDRGALAPAEGMRLVYQRLLARIAANPGAVFGPRVSVPLHEKALCTAIAWLGARGGGGA